MQDRPTERVCVLLDGLTASAIVDRVHPYYSGYQFEGEWLDTLKESIEGELDDLDRIIRGRADTWRVAAEGVHRGEGDARVPALRHGGGGGRVGWQDTAIHRVCRSQLR